MTSNEINISWQQWQTKSLSIVQDCIPKGVLPKRRPVSWITKQITYTQVTFTLLETGDHNPGYGCLLEITGI